MPVSYPIGAFKPFSLADTIRAGQAGQARRLNELKIQSAESQMAREAKLRGLAQMATKPIYGPAEGPPEPVMGGQPVIQTGTEYSPEKHAQLAGQAGETELAAKLREQVAQMSESERAAAKDRATGFAQLVASTKGDPDAWDANFQTAVDQGFVTPDQYVPYSDQAWQTAMNKARDVEDIIDQGTPTSQRGVSTTLQEMKYLEDIKDPVERKRKEDLMMELKGRNKIKQIAGDTYLVGPGGGLYKLGSATAEAEFTKEEAKSKAEGTTKGKAVAQAKIDLPKIRGEAEYLKNIVRKAVEHPGFTSVVGMPSLGKLSKYVGGTPEADFNALQNQIEGKTFLKAYETLKGGGQITEIEGEKATNALQRLKASSSEDAYREAADEFISEIDRLTDLAERRAKGDESIPREFMSVDEAESANLPVGTEVIIDGRRAIVE